MTIGRGDHRAIGRKTRFTLDVEAQRYHERPFVNCRAAFAVWYYDFCIEREEEWGQYDRAEHDIFLAGREQIRSCSSMEELVDKVRELVARDHLPVWEVVKEFPILAGVFGTESGNDSE
jgi:hypothetical protein